MVPLLSEFTVIHLPASIMERVLLTLECDGFLDRLFAGWISESKGMINWVHTSTSVASASMTDTLRVLWRVIYRTDWIMDRVLRVPTATLGRSGVNRKKFLGLTTTWYSRIRTSRQLIFEIRTYNVVVSCIQRFEQAGCSPTTSEHHESFFFWVKGHLWPRMLVALCYEVEYTDTTDS